jgi:hypothetical protein
MVTGRRCKPRGTSSPAVWSRRKLVSPWWSATTKPWCARLSGLKHVVGSCRAVKGGARSYRDVILRELHQGSLSAALSLYGAG